MSIRTTVVLENDVIERVKLESKSRGVSFRETLNDLLRVALISLNEKPRRTLEIKPFSMGPLRPGLSYDNIEALLEYGEGELHR